MNGKVIKVVIDHRDYFFKLGSDEEVNRLQQLADKLTKRIQTNKRSIATNDYTKVLILTCLDLLEENNQKQPTPEPASNVNEEKLLKKLIEINSILKRERS